MNTADKHLFWNKHLADWSGSGLSQKAYCLQQGLKPATFSYWRKGRRSPDAACGKLIRLPISAGNLSVRISVSGLKLDVPVSALSQVLPIVLRNQHVNG